MKTSNKLLIILGVLLIVIPIAVIAIDVKLHYENSETLAIQVENDKHFATPSKGYSSKSLNNFSNINFVGGKDFDMEIRIVNDHQNGIKIPDDIMNHLDIQTATDGTIMIKTKNIDSARFYQPIIYIYSSNKINKLICKDGNNLIVKVSTDSLLFDVKGFSEVSFDDQSAVDKLKVNAKNIQSLSIAMGMTKNISMYLDDVTFGSSDLSFGTLNIASCKNSEIRIDGNIQEEGIQKIRELIINTQGRSSISLSYIKLEKISGNVSDSTIVNMPVINLKQLFKK